MCDKLAEYRFTWPGQDEALICGGHVGALRKIASAMGLHLQVIPLSEKELMAVPKCQQKS